MRTSTDPRMTLSHEDAERLAQLLASIQTPRDPEVVARLEHELGRARIVAAAQIPRDVVTMHARVVFENLDDGRRRVVTLVYPGQADIASGRVSVLSAVGSALLGLARGEEIAWPLPRGRMGHLKVLEVERAEDGVSAGARDEPPR